MESIKITKLSVAPLLGATPKGGWANEIEARDSVHSIIRVVCDRGVSGYGSVFTNGPLALAGVQTLRDLVVGQSALEPRKVTEGLHQHTFWMGRGGTLTNVISGINIALYDLLGKITGLPVSTLLGGRHVERVKPYCSLLMEEPDRMEEVVLKFREQGYRAFKLGWGPFGRKNSFQNDEDIIARARTALGDEEEILVDAGASDAYWPHGLPWARRTAEMLAAYDIGWFEEPIRPDDLQAFSLLRRSAPLPIAGGEVLTRRQSFLPALQAGAFDIVQPDVTKVGGIDEQLDIARMADAHGVAYVGHGWNTAFGLAADLHLAAALPGTRYVEYIGGSAYVDGIVETPFEIDADGFLAVPLGPGLGIEMNPDAVSNYVTDPSILFE